MTWTRVVEVVSGRALPRLQRYSHQVDRPQIGKQKGDKNNSWVFGLRGGEKNQDFCFALLFEILDRCFCGI